MSSRAESRSDGTESKDPSSVSQALRTVLRLLRPSARVSSPLRLLRFLLFVFSYIEKAGKVRKARNLSQPRCPHLGRPSCLSGGRWPCQGVDQRLTAVEEKARGAATCRPRWPPVSRGRARGRGWACSPGRTRHRTRAPSGLRTAFGQTARHQSEHTKGIPKSFACHLHPSAPTISGLTPHARGIRWSAARFLRGLVGKDVRPRCTKQTRGGSLGGPPAAAKQRKNTRGSTNGIR